MAKAAPFAAAALFVALSLLLGVAQAQDPCSLGLNGGCMTGGGNVCQPGYANVQGDYQSGSQIGVPLSIQGSFTSETGAARCCGECANLANCVYWDAVISSPNGQPQVQCRFYTSATCPTRVNTNDATRRSGGGCAPAANGDPHFVGFRGKEKYDFTGHPGTNYCIISDRHVQVNSLFGGYISTEAEAHLREAKPYTWFYKLAVLVNGHNVIFSSRRGPEVDYLDGFLESITVDGEEVKLAPHEEKVYPEGTAIRFKEANKTITVFGLDVYQADVYELEIKGIMKLELTARPAHPDLRTPEEAHVHFDLQFLSIELSQSAHGVLGQTFPEQRLQQHYNFSLAPAYDHSGSMVAGLNAEGYLDGTVDDYKTSALLAADCNFNRFQSLALGDAAGKGTGRRMLDFGLKPRPFLRPYSGVLQLSGK